MNHDPLCPEPKCDYGSLNEGACYGYGDCTHWCQCELIAKADARGYSRAHTELLKVEIGTGNAQGGAGHGLGGGPLRPTLGGKS